jgi:serine phosphatase RsbU (regulator of sigma subunit)
MVSNSASRFQDSEFAGSRGAMTSPVTGLAPLTGRDHEVDLLKDRWEQAGEGMGQVVLLIGEPGLGKSRLVNTLKEHVLGQAVEGEVDSPVIEWRCSPHFQNSGLRPAIDFYERALDFGPDEPAPARFDRLLRRLEAYELAQPESVPFWASLLGLPATDHFPTPALPPNRQREETFRVMLEWLHRRAARKPVLFIVEDLHWVDASTLEFLGQFLAEGLHDRILTLLTFRPEFKTPWPAVAHQTSLALNRLTRRQIGELLSKNADGPLPQELIQQIYERTRGVPLFVEEVARMLRESRQLDRERKSTERDGSGPAIPSSLRDLVLGRLNNMTKNPEVAQIAATLGREFAYEVLAAVTTIGDATLQNELETLVRSEILYQKGCPPRATYMFKHALLEGALHEALAEEKRRQFHRQIALALESRFPETALSLPELLAHHFTEAGLTQNAIDYWLKAGQRSIDRSAFAEAIGHLTQGLALVGTLEESRGRDMQELQFLMRLAPAYIAARGYAAPEAGPVLLRARELCQRLGDSQHQFGVMLGMWEWHIVRGDLRTCVEQADEGMAIARSLSDPGVMMEALFMPAVTMFYRAEFAGSRDHCETALANYDDRDRTKFWTAHTGHDSGVTHRCYLALDLWHLGYPDQALALARDVCELARSIGHGFSRAHAVDFVAFLCHYCRLGAELKTRADEEMAIATDQGFPFWHALGTLHKGAGMLLDGQPREALALLKKGFAAFRASGAEIRVPAYLAMLGEAHTHLGEFEAAHKALEEGVAVAKKNDDRCHEAELHRLRGELILAEFPERVVEAEGYFRRAIETAQRHKSKGWELRATTSLARLWYRQGRAGEARTVLAAIHGTYTEGFTTPDVLDAKAMLDTVDNERMRDDIAAGVKYVLECIPPPLQGPVSIGWRYIPSLNLGGDMIGYHWIDDDHLALYLIDVTGHGIDSALLSVTIANLLRSGSLPGADMRRPDQVLAKLNDAFPGDMHGGKFFTTWYGVYQPSSRVLTWAGGGHHPALLLGAREPSSLASTGPMIGVFRGAEFSCESCRVDADARLLIFSDGVFEIVRDDRVVWNLEGCLEYLATHGASNTGNMPLMDQLLAHVQTLRGATQLDDDFSIIDARFR